MSPSGKEKKDLKEIRRLLWLYQVLLPNTQGDTTEVTKKLVSIKCASWHHCVITGGVRHAAWP